ncbi:hypothetical protein OROGR_028374 [Orobanche gracilis]
MDCNRNYIIITYIMMFNIAWSWPLVHGSGSNNNDTLDNYLYDYALEQIHNPRTGKLYHVPLPANLSGVELSFSRLHTHSLWTNGANHTSYFSIPPSTLPWPLTKRVDIVYQNLGNWSSYYFDVPNHTFVTPIIGFLVYDPNTTSTNQGPIELELVVENPIIVRFPNFFIQKDMNIHEAMKCVRFDTNGTLELSDLTLESTCVVDRQGHFSVVIPNPSGTDKVIKRWVIVGVLGGFMLMVLVFVACVVGYDKWVKWNRIKKMDRMSDTNVALDTIWIGRSKMPFGDGTRTQPDIENRYVP